CAAATSAGPASAPSRGVSRRGRTAGETGHGGREAVVIADPSLRMYRRIARRPGGETRWDSGRPGAAGIGSSAPILLASGRNDRSFQGRAQTLTRAATGVAGTGAPCG